MFYYMSTITYAIIIVLSSIFFWSLYQLHKNCKIFVSDAEYIVNTIFWDHNAKRVKKMDFEDGYSLTYNRNLTEDEKFFYLYIYFYKDNEQIGSIEYCYNLTSRDEKIIYNDVPKKELKLFKKFIKKYNIENI